MNKLAVTREFEVLKAKRPQDQIADHLREEISNGNLKPGARLPSTQELAVRWKTHPTTVQRAMEPLVKEGLLVRITRVGTFVRERKEKLTCVGVYCRATDVKDSPYTHAVRAALVKELRKAGIEMDLWTDSRPVDQLGEPWEPLVKAAQKRRFQAFIGTDMGVPSLKWLQKLPVPTAFLANDVPTGVTNALEQFIDLSLQELARQGCRSVGLIGPIDPEDVGSNPDAYSSHWLGILEHFVAVAGDLKLQVKNSWMQICRSRDWMRERTHSQFGYEGFMNLWGQPEKPEGLVVYPDSVVTGTIMAIREKQVRVPKDLKLVLCKNETIDLFCPMPATFLVLSERDTARALMKQIQRQFRGESCEPISLPFKIVAHDNSNGPKI